MSDTALRVPAQWTNDCQGKKDFDGALVMLSTRYWPRGGGFSVLLPGAREFVDSGTLNDSPPSAHATIYLGSTANEFYGDAVELIDVHVEAGTEDLVKAQVEAWAAEQFQRIGRALRREFHVEEA
jgi:hypothetical protein